MSPESRQKQIITRLKNVNVALKKVVFDLRKTVNLQQRKIDQLETKLQDKESQRKLLLSYLYKPQTASKEKKKRGKRPGAMGFQRQTPKDSEVTHKQEFPLAACPTCERQLSAPVDQVIKYEEDIDLAPKKIIKQFVIPRYWCPRCQDFVKSPHVPPIVRIGPNVMAYVLYARYRLRLPQLKIKESLQDLHNFTISEGEVAEKIQEAQALFGKDYQAISELIKTAKVVYADETGWRMEGENWFLWVFTSKKQTRYIISPTRGGGVAEDALGTKKDRVIVSDGYKVYQNLPGKNQQCWVHLLRVAKFHSMPMYEDLLKIYLKLQNELLKLIKDRDPPYVEKRLQSILETTYPEPLASKVQARISNHQKLLLTCLGFDGVLPENNTAERAIRNHVVMRKIFGSSRSVSGAYAHEVNTSVIDTMAKQYPSASFFSTMVPLIKKRLEEKQGKHYSES